MALECLLKTAPPQYSKDRVARSFGWASYYDYLHEGDRVYDEAIRQILAVWGTRRSTFRSSSVINLLAAVDTVTWPSHDTVLWTFDSTTGELLSRQEHYPGDLSFIVRHVSVSRNGELWAEINSSYTLLDPETFEFTDQWYPYDHWVSDDGTVMGPVSRHVTWALFDRPRDLAVLHSIFNWHDEVSVHRLSDGQMLSRVKVAGRPAEIHPAAAGGSCYVMARSGVITVLDYIYSRAVGVLRQRPDPEAVQYQYGFDPTLQRLLLYSHLPENPDGSAANGINAFFPLPLPTQLQTPIPLVAPRTGRTVPVLTRCSGNTSEGVAGRILNFSYAGPNAGVPMQSRSQPGGWALAHIAAEDAGNATVTVTTETTECPP